MSKVKRFVETFKRSMYDLTFYKELSARPFKSALFYLYLLLVISTGIFLLKSVVFLIPKIPQIDPLIEKVQSIVQTAYPSELVVTIDNGELKTNVSEPYYIDVPKGINKPEIENIHLIAIDTEGIAENFSRYRSMILVTRTSVVTPDNDGLKITPFQKNLNLVIDRNSYDNLVSKAGVYLKFVKPLLIYGGIMLFIFGPWIGALLALYGKLLFILFFSIPLLLLAKVIRSNLRYGEIYKMSIYGLTSSIVISTLQSYVPSTAGGTFGPFDWVYRNLPTLTFSGFMILVILKFRKTEAYNRSS